MPLFNGESNLREMLSDPMVLAVMERDGVDPGCLRALLRDIHRAQQALAERVGRTAGEDPRAR